MNRTLKDHLAYLEERIVSLKARESDLNLAAVERHQAAIDLGIAERALSTFRKAYELEQKIKRSQFSN